MTAFSFVLSQCPQNHNHTICCCLPASMNPPCPHSTEKHLHNFSLYALFFPAQLLNHSQCFLPTPWVLPWALCQPVPARPTSVYTHCQAVLQTGTKWEIIETSFQPSTACVCTGPVKSASKILQAAQAGWKWERNDLLSADVLQLCTQSVAEANQRHKSFLQAFNSISADSHCKVADTQRLVTAS